MTHQGFLHSYLSQQQTADSWLLIENNLAFKIVINVNYYVAIIAFTFSNKAVFYFLKKHFLLKLQNNSPLSLNPLPFLISRFELNIIVDVIDDWFITALRKKLKAFISSSLVKIHSVMISCNTVIYRRPNSLPWSAY